MAHRSDQIYVFERSDEGGPGIGERLAPGQHSWAEGLREANVLARRLEIPAPLMELFLGEAAVKSDPALHDVRNLFVQMGADFSANIAYYEQQMDKVRKQLVATQILAGGVLVGLLAGLIAIVVPWSPEAKVASQEQSSLWVAQLSLVGTVIFAVLKALAVGTNYKARLTGFWTAAADLREALYTFEANWQNKLGTREALLSPDFQVALYEELRAARLVVRKEREGFIDAMASPNDIFSSASDVLVGIDARVGNVMSARQNVQQASDSLAVTTAKDVAETRRRLLEAKSKLASAEAALPDAVNAGVVDLDSYKRAIVDARAEVNLYTGQLRLKLKSDRLNPT